MSEKWEDPCPWIWVGNNSGAHSGRCATDVPDDSQHAYHGVYEPRTYEEWMNGAKT